MTSRDAEALRFHFDYLSPYAFLGATQIHALAARHGRRVEFVPVLFAGLLGAHGTLGPAEVPAKRSYVIRDSFRKASALGVALSAPPLHPFNPLLALRVSSLPMPDAQRRALVTGLFAATWSPGVHGTDPPGITDPAVVSEVASRAGLDGEAAVAEAVSPESKQRVHDQTERAVAEGVFGVPTIIVDGELFWGVDSLDLLERFLAGDAPEAPEALARWDRTPLAVTRKR